MSSPRYDWWGYVKGMIRRYPMLCLERNENLEQKITVNYNAFGRSSNVNRAIENVVIKECLTTEEREYWAVTKAIEMTKKLPNGKSRIKIIELVYWKRSHTLKGAAKAVCFSERSTERFHTEFIRAVASCYGLLDK